MSYQRWLLRIHGVIAIIFGIGTFSLVYIASDPALRAMLDDLSVRGNYMEAHGLMAFVGAALLLGSQAPRRFWHVWGAGSQALLAFTNISIWPLFATMRLVMTGYLSTGLCLLLILLHGVALATFKRPSDVARA